MKEFSWVSLHWITKVLVVATAVHIAGDTLFALKDLARQRTLDIDVGTLLATEGRAYAYSMLFLGSAATVELLYRIWRELRTLRLSGVTPVSEAAEPE